MAEAGPQWESTIQMAPLTTAQSENFKSGEYAVRGFVYVTQPRVVFQARVNGTSPRAVTSVSYDQVTFGTFGDIQAGMTITIGSSEGARDYGINRVRGSASGSIIPVNRSAWGGGIGEMYAVDHAYITVYEDYRVWAKIPYINPESGQQYKDERVFANSTAQPPIAVIDSGDRLLIIQQEGQSAVLSFDATGSVAVADGATIDNYSWDFADGATGIQDTSSPNITVQWNGTGERWISLTVTDSNGNNHTTRRLIVLALEEDCIEAIVSTENITPEGVNVSFTIPGEDLPAAMLPGVKVLYSQEEYWGNVNPGVYPGVITGQETKFSGWVASSPTSISGDGSTADLRCVDVAGRLRELPGFPQRVNNAASAGNWYEMENLNIDRYVHYILHWHSTALEVAPYLPSNRGSVYPFPALESSGATLYQQVDQLARAIACRFTCTTTGKIQVKPDPIIQPTQSQRILGGFTYERTSVVEESLDEGDYSQINFDAVVAPRNHWLIGEGIRASSSDLGVFPYFCRAPGKVPGQGPGASTRGQQVVEHPSELYARIGHEYAARFNPEVGNIRLTLTRPAWVWEPADMFWVNLTLSDEFAAQNNVTFTSARTLIKSIQNRYDHERGSKTSVMVLEPELIGLAAEVEIRPTPQQFDATDYGEDFGVGLDFTTDWELPEYYEDQFPDQSFIEPGVTTLAAIGNEWTDATTSTPFMWITQNFGSDMNTTWTGTDLQALGVSGRVLQMEADINNAGQALIVTTNEIGVLFDVFGSPSYASRFTFPYTTTARVAKIGLANRNFWVVMTHYSSSIVGDASTEAGVWATFSLNGGIGWTNTRLSTPSGSGPGWGAQDNKQIGLHVSNVTPGTVYFWSPLGRGGSGMNAGLFKTADYFGTVTRDTTTFGNIPSPGSYFNFASNFGAAWHWPYLWETTGRFDSYLTNFAGTGSGAYWYAYWDGLTADYFSTVAFHPESEAFTTSYTNAAFGAAVDGRWLYVGTQMPDIELERSVEMADTTELLHGPDLRKVNIADDNQTIFAYGHNAIAISRDGGLTIDRQWGDIHESLAVNAQGLDIVGIMGG